MTNSPVVWGNPTSLEGWWWLVSAKLYQVNLKLPDLFPDFIPPTQFVSIIAIALVIVCLVGLRKYRDNLSKDLKIPLDAAISVTAGGYFVFAALYSTDDAILFTLPAFILLALLLCKTAVRAGPWLMILPMILLAINLTEFQPADRSLPRLIAEETLRGAPEGAIVITSGERTTFTLWYLQFVEELREDLLLVDKDLFQFDWYRQRLGNKYPLLQNLERDDLEGFVAENRTNHGVCTANLERGNRLFCW